MDTTQRTCCNLYAQHKQIDLQKVELEIKHLSEEVSDVIHNV